LRNASASSLAARSAAKAKTKKNIVSDAGSNPNYGHTHTPLANLELGEIVKKRPRSTRGPQIHLLADIIITTRGPQIQAPT
jgi:hypothetical protein